jgi:hypothetical protein
MCATWQIGQADAAFGSSWCHKPPAARMQTNAANAAASSTRCRIARTTQRGAGGLIEFSRWFIEFA